MDGSNFCIERFGRPLEKMKLQFSLWTTRFDVAHSNPATQRPLCPCWRFDLGLFLWTLGLSLCSSGIICPTFLCYTLFFIVLFLFSFFLLALQKRNQWTWNKIKKQNSLVAFCGPFLSISCHCYLIQHFAFTQCLIVLKWLKETWWDKVRDENRTSWKGTVASAGICLNRLDLLLYAQEHYIYDLCKIVDLLPIASRDEPK